MRPKTIQPPPTQRAVVVVGEDADEGEGAITAPRIAGSGSRRAPSRTLSGT